MRHNHAVAKIQARYHICKKSINYMLSKINDSHLLSFLGLYWDLKAN